MTEEEKIVIRKIEEKDIPSVADIRINGWKAAYQGIIDENFLNEMDRNQEIKKREKDYQENGFIVAELNQEIVGFCRYIENNKFSPDQKDIDCEITALYVKPEKKGQGIGTRLFQFVIEEFKGKMKEKMIIWCLKDNVCSHKFYRKMGGEMNQERVRKIGEKNYSEVSFIYSLDHK